MKSRKGQAIVEWTVFLCILLVLGGVVFGICNKYVFGNKQVIDLKQNFNVAYVLGDDAKFERVEISKWCDYDKSDTIQVITKDGRTIYTHSSNVKLVKEKQHGN